MTAAASSSPQARIAAMGRAIVAATLLPLGCGTSTVEQASTAGAAQPARPSREPRSTPSARNSALPSAAPSVAPQNSGPKTFAAAKRLLRERVYADHRTTLYCDCPFDESWKLDRTACSYQPTGKNARALRIEWEHVVPAQAFGQSLPAWRDGDPRCVGKNGRRFRGRDCARKTSALFRRMEADLHNLFPAVGELNGRRSNYSMALIDGERRDLGTCDIEIADRKIEPRPAIRGDIARTYLYMDATYPGRGIVSRKNRPLFRAWSEADPVDAWECERARRIQKLQPTPNEIVNAACAALTRHR